MSNGHLKGVMDKPVFCPALCFSYHSGDEDIPDVIIADNDIQSYATSYIWGASR